MLQLCMQDEWFKVQAFRFIDVLPMMQTDVDVARHLKEYFVLPERTAGRNGHRRAQCAAEHGRATAVAKAGQVHSGHDGRGPHYVLEEQEAALRELEGAPATGGMVRLVSRLMNFRRLDSASARLFVGCVAEKLGMDGREFYRRIEYRGGRAGDPASLRGRQLAFTIDVLGEAALSGIEAEAYQQTYLDLIGQLPRHAAQLATGAAGR